MSYKRIAQLRTFEEFRAYCTGLGIDLPVDADVIPAPEGPLAQPYRLPDGFVIGNRFCVQPMEGWDGTPDGSPSEHTRRRWRNFGISGAKLVWGGEAVAVRHDGRANPNQLMIDAAHLEALRGLRNELVQAHEAAHGRSDDLLIGLQLTHSGRFSRPNSKALEAVIAYHHPYLDQKFGISPQQPAISDAEIGTLIGDFVRAAEQAQAAGFDFVDIKHCHGYLGHELLSAYTRPGDFGGSFENRTRFLREVVAGIRRTAPGLRIGVRLSAFDLIAFRPGANGTGEAVEVVGYPRPFGAAEADPLRIDLDEPGRFLDLLRELGVTLVNLTAGSPYYNPHIQRPALFPPSDGYEPPEDPLLGVARQIAAAGKLKQAHPELLIVGTGYSYLQEWLPKVAQAVIRQGLADFIGLGRMMLSYPELASDVLAGRPLERKRLCRSFSDCTTAPRKAMISGCYPLDSYYKSMPEYEQLQTLKARQKQD